MVLTLHFRAFTSIYTKYRDITSMISIDNRAGDVAKSTNHKTITSQHVIKALEEAEFDDFIPILTAALNARQEEIKAKRKTTIKQPQQSSPKPGSATNGSDNLTNDQNEHPGESTNETHGDDGDMDDEADDDEGEAEDIDLGSDEDDQPEESVDQPAKKRKTDDGPPTMDDITRPENMQE
ncbi:negative cofactor 2 transcription regulator complex subunit ncb2 [Dispira simplex]|nr:negative cofactor 2 transcription regulator complex subunit ncb2 [Dispira simplex]